MFIAWTTGNHFTFKKKVNSTCSVPDSLTCIYKFLFLCSIMYMKSRSRSKKYAIPSKEIYIKSTENTKGY